MSGDAQSYIAGLPKAELHLHIEGTLEPGMVFALAARNKIALPYASIDALRRAYDFADLQDFLNLYYRATQVLVNAQDFYDLTRAYLQKAHAQNIRHVEIFVDPQAHLRRGIPFEAVIEGISGALDDAERDDAITSRLIMCFLRDLDETDALETLARAQGWLHKIHGVGLDSAERGNPPAKFATVFARAHALGLHCVAHAGEEGPPAYIYEALDVLKVERIDHGVRAIEDAALTTRLARDGVPLTVCPLSNIRLRVYAQMEQHPLQRLMQAGVMTTINSDDPAYFGGYLNENYLAVQKAFGFTKAQIDALARNSFTASFLSDAEKRDHIAAIDAYSANAPQFF